MSQELAPQQEPAYTPAQLALITRTVAQGATKDELMMFLHVCKKSKLDPFMRQIHFVKRGGKATIQVGIDGYRAIAERTGAYAGSDEPIYEYFDDTKQLVKATVRVYKLINNVRYAFSASAHWDEYKPQAGQDFMWQKMPHVMLGKVAEALALRKAFPNDLSGLYTQEEMAQAGSNPPQDELTYHSEENALPEPSQEATKPTVEAKPVKAVVAEAPKATQPATSIPECAIHHKPMSRNTRGFYCPNKTVDGNWCNYKPGAPVVDQSELEAIGNSIEY